jgi:hypothetical protein
LSLSFFFDAHRLAVNYIDKTSDTGDFGQNRNSVRVPTEQTLAFFDWLLVRYLENSAVRYFEFIKFTSFAIKQY